MASNNPAAPPRACFRDASVSLGQLQVLAGVNLEVMPGEIHALIGRHGEGKSAVCGVMAGEMALTGGSLWFDGRPLPPLSIGQAKNLGIEKAGERPELFLDLTVEDNLAAGCFRSPNRYWLGRRALSRRVGEWLERFGLSLPLNEKMRNLAMGERIFAHVLSCLFNQPRLLILDETLEHLPRPRLKEFLPMLQVFQRGGMAVLWATQKLEEAWSLADRISVIRRGRILLTDSPRRLNQSGLIKLVFAENYDSPGEENFEDSFRSAIRYTEAVLRDLPTAIVVADARDRVQFVNSQGRYFFPGGVDPAGETTLSGLVGEENAGLLDMFHAALAGGEDARSHSMLVMAGIGERLVDLHIRMVRDDVSVIGAILIAEDISEREKIRQNLIVDHNLASLGLLAAGVAHEVNNPLEIIGNYLSLLLRSIPVGRERNHVLNIREETRRIQEIVRNLVTFTSRRAADQSEVDLHLLVTELADLLRHNGQNARICFHCPAPDSPAVITANPNEMRQVLLNLFRNSIEAMPNGGDIAVEFVRPADAALEMRFRDNGPGIGLKNLDDVFLPFASSKMGANLHQGLGLSIVHGLVEKANGRITVSNLPGGGCEFLVRFLPPDPSAPEALVTATNRG